MEEVRDATQETDNNQIKSETEAVSYIEDEADNVINGFENDSLGRKEYAINMREIIDNYEENYAGGKRGTDNIGFVIGITATCGSGKTVFLKMFKEYLKNEGYIVMYYDAWENDFGKDAFSPFFKIILETNEVKDVTNDYTFNLWEVLHAIIRYITMLNPYGIDHGIDWERWEELIDDKLLQSKRKKQNKRKKKNSSDDTTIEGERLITRYAAEHKLQEDAIESLRLLLTRVYEDQLNKQGSNEQDKHGTEEKPHKIVICIDELDRCRPDFAVQTLEIIKHFFNIENVVFVLAFDFVQLSSTIRKFYGDTFNASGYLSRFFDKLSILPEGKINELVKTLLEKNELTLEHLGIIDTRTTEYLKDLPNAVLNLDRGMQRDEWDRSEKEQCEKRHRIKEEQWCATVGRVCGIFSLPPRDIKLVMSAFKKLTQTTLRRYKDINALILYFYFVSMKYRFPGMFINALEGVRSSSETKGENGADELNAFIRRNPIPFWYERITEVEESYRSLIISKYSIGDLKKGWIIYHDGNMLNHEQIDEICNMTCDNDGGKTDRKRSLMYRSRRKNTMRSIDDVESISFVLYDKDIEKITGFNREVSNKINNLRIFDYLHRMIEAYDYNTSVELLDQYRKTVMEEGMDEQFNRPTR